MGYQLPTNPDSINIAGHTVLLGGTQNLAAADLSNGVVGSGSVVLGTAPTLTTPTLGNATATSLNAPSAGQSISFSPTGNTPTTLGSLVVTGTAISANGREFVAAFGMTSSIGDGGTAGNDKLPLYAGIVGRSGSSDIWAVNFLTEIDSGFFKTTHVAQIAEFDINNFDKDVLVSATTTGMVVPYSVGLEISGDIANGTTIFRNTLGIGINGGSFQFGMGVFSDISQSSFYEHTSAQVGLDVQGSHATAGIRVGGSSTIADLRAGTNQRLLVRGAVSLSDGVSLFAVNDLNSLTTGLELDGSIVQFSGQVIKVPNIPTSDPHIVGQLWNNSGVLTVSAG